jgi:hypothetical protein
MIPAEKTQIRIFISPTLASLNVYVAMNHYPNYEGNFKQQHRGSDEASGRTDCQYCFWDIDYTDAVMALTETNPKLNLKNNTRSQRIIFLAC